MDKKKILVFTGAGISAESGIKTFRDSQSGLWYNFDIKEVASLDGWNKDKGKVLEFYNQRRREMKDSTPNKAHEFIAKLEEHFDVTVVTQNVDNLHERAGSKNVIHLHGELTKMRSTYDESTVLDCDGDIKLGDRCPEGSQLRPHIVWFGEMLDRGNLKASRDAAEDADVCIIVGTSMQVAPANTIPFLTQQNSLIYYIDPGEADFHVPSSRSGFFYHINEVATTGTEKVYNELVDIFINNPKTK
jgi:NAD-dependent deacetylase